MPCSPLYALPTGSVGSRRPIPHDTGAVPEPIPHEAKVPPRHELREQDQRMPRPTVPRPLVNGLPIRRVGTFQQRGPAWWFVSCHGGAGSSTLAAAAGGGGVDAGRQWPVPEPPGIARVVLVARTHASGLRAAQAGARQWAAGAVPRVQLLGLVAVADAPGRLPRPLRELLELIEGGFPRVWRLPWVEALRLGDPPAQAGLPTSFARLTTDLHEMTRSGGVQWSVH